VINQSLAPLPVTDPILISRKQNESRFLREVAEKHASRFAVIPWQLEAPVGLEHLRSLTEAQNKSIESN
jgi:arsenite-transporting ATPase